MLALKATILVYFHTHICEETKKLEDKLSTATLGS